jgi:hypothetical protein
VVITGRSGQIQIFSLKQEIAVKQSMHKSAHKKLAGICLILTALFAAASSAAEDPATVNRDLTSVIALLGLPCGEVVSNVATGNNDHIATCKDGNRYRVFVNAEGRVVAQKL